MGLSLEPFVSPALDAPGHLAGRPLDDWNAAYVRVENYFHALQVRNKLLLGRLVLSVMDRAIERALREPDLPAMALAAEEMDRLVGEWYAAVLDESVAEGDLMLATRGRLALLISDMPGRWQDQFLRPGPWPEEFVRSMRDNFFRAGPDFQISQMTPRPLDLGAITTLGQLKNLPYFGFVLLWLAVALLFVLGFYLTH